MGDELLESAEELLEKVKKDFESGDFEKYRGISPDIISDEYLINRKTSREEWEEGRKKIQDGILGLHYKNKNYTYISQAISRDLNKSRERVQHIVDAIDNQEAFNNYSYTALYDAVISYKMQKDAFEKNTNDLKKTIQKDERIKRENESVSEVFGGFEIKKEIRDKNGMISAYANKSVKELEEERDRRFAILNELHNENKISNEELKKYVISLRRVYARSIEDQSLAELKEEKERIEKESKPTEKIKKQIKSAVSKIAQIFRFNVFENEVDQDNSPSVERMIITSNATKVLEKVRNVIKEKDDVSRPEVEAELNELYNTKIDMLSDKLCGETIDDSHGVIRKIFTDKYEREKQIYTENIPELTDVFKEVHERENLRNIAFNENLKEKLAEEESRFGQLFDDDGNLNTQIDSQRDIFIAEMKQKFKTENIMDYSTAMHQIVDGEKRIYGAKVIGFTFEDPAIQEYYDKVMAKFDKNSEKLQEIIEKKDFMKDISSEYSQKFDSGVTT